MKPVAVSVTVPKPVEEPTKITFEYSWQRAPLSERVAAPLVRSVLRRANARAMQRLSEQLAAA